MAKSSKIEDYWRQNNIESLLKDITHTLAQKMPPDPAAAIVQYLQKKFPKSFKTPLDDSTNLGMASKAVPSTLRSQSMFSPRSDASGDIDNTMDMERRASNQSQVSGIATVPTVGTAFTDLLKQNTSTTKEAPDINMRNLVFANRLSQKVVRLGKDIQSDRDILEEESIKPSTAEASTPSTSHTSDSLGPTDPQQAKAREEPVTKQLIKYKQHIHLQNDRRSHREKLAALAEKEREKEQFLHPEQETKLDEIQQQQQHQKSPDHYPAPHVQPGTGSTKSTHKPMLKSKEEEDLLNDENIFQPERRRLREKPRTRLSTSRSNSPSGHREFVRNLASTIRGRNGTLIPGTESRVCKVCGSVINNDGDRSKQYAQQVSAAPTGRSFQHQPSAQSETSSGENVDDWFDSASEVSGSREIVPWKPDDITPQPVDTKSVQQSLFRPIDNNRALQTRPPMPPAVLIDNETKSGRSTTPRLSESDIFVRTPEPTSRRSPSSRVIPSPVSKRSPTDMFTATDRQSPKTTTYMSSPPLFSSTARSASGSGAREHSADDSNEN